MASAGRQTKPTESAGKCNPLQARVKKGISTQVKDITTTEIKYQPTNISRQISAMGPLLSLNSAIESTYALVALAVGHSARSV